MKAARASANRHTLDELQSAYGDVALATLSADLPTTDAWSYELKYDGYRILALKTGSEVRLLSRRGQDWTSQFSAVAEDVARLKLGESVLDGEVCAIDAKGVPSFQLLQNRARGVRLVYFVFDILCDAGEDTRGLPIEERRARLAGALKGLGGDTKILISASVEGDPSELRRSACEAGLEGLIAKQSGSKYTTGRSRSWLKLKCTSRQEFAIIGWLPLEQNQRAVGSLVLGLMEADGRLHFAGKVGTGFDAKSRSSLWTQLSAHETKERSAVGVPKFGGLVHFVEPSLVAEVAFTEFTDAGHLRHPSFQGLRKDKFPRDCTREKPVKMAESEKPKVKASTLAKAKASTAAKAKTAARVDVGGVSISHADRVLDPAGVTKLELARYYEAIGEWMVPHVAGRPLTLLRWGGGKENEKGGTFLRHAKAWGPTVLRRVQIQEKKKVGEYLVADDTRALIGLAQMDILEIHTWNSVIEKVEFPNRMVIDLDPAPDVKWKAVVDAALEVRARLKESGLESWVKTTGGKGLHVVAPLRADADWDACLTFTRDLADAMAADDPKRYLASMSKAARTSRIFIDYLRNNRTNTSIAAYSIRAREDAPVSVPISWNELVDVDPRAFTMTAVESRMKKMRKDPWASYWKTKQSISKGARR